MFEKQSKKTIWATDQSGAVAVFMALMLPVLVGMVALAVEYGLWLVTRSDLQRTADAAAYSAALSLEAGAANVFLPAERVVTTQAPNALSSLRVNFPPQSGTNSGSNTHVEVELTETVPRFLSQMFISGDQSVFVRAVAGYSSGTEACIMTTSQSASVGVNLDGPSIQKLNLSGCGITSNSASSTSVRVTNGELNLTDTCVNAAGGVDANTMNAITRNASCSAPNLNAGAVADPYSYILSSLPIAANLNFCQTSSSAQMYFAEGTWPRALSYPFRSQLGYGAECIRNGMWHVVPCTSWYCSGNPDAYGNYTNDKSSPNILIIDGGILRLGPGQYFWEETTILLLNGADLLVEGLGAALRLRAPTSGPFAGFALIATPGSDITIRGELNFSLSGIFYAPNSDINLIGTNWSGIRFDTIYTPDYRNEECAQFIGRSLNVTGPGIYNVTCDVLLPGMSRMTASTPVRLVE